MKLGVCRGIANKVRGVGKNRKSNMRGDVYLAPESICFYKDRIKSVKAHFSLAQSTNYPHAG